MFDTQVEMWCYEEDVSLPTLLTSVYNMSQDTRADVHITISVRRPKAYGNRPSTFRPPTTCSHVTDTSFGLQINEKHENVKYLPEVDLGDNVHAEPDLLKAVKGANALIFVIPHQFIPDTCKQLVGHVPKDAQAISLVKGVEVKEDKIHIFSEVIKEHLGIECAALSGANIANEVAKDKFSETTIGCRDIEAAKKWAKLFESEFFRVAVNKDVLGVSLGGALKNVVAVAAGFIDGLQWGNNAKVSFSQLSQLFCVSHADSLSHFYRPLSCVLVCSR